MNQLPLFPEPKPVTLSPQQKKILGRLRRGPATNHELTEICERHTAREWELRQKGYDIKKRKIGKSTFRYWIP